VLKVKNISGDQNKLLNKNPLREERRRNIHLEKHSGKKPTLKTTKGKRRRR